MKRMNDIVMALWEGFAIISAEAQLMFARKSSKNCTWTSTPNIMDIINFISYCSTARISWLVEPSLLFLASECFPCFRHFILSTSISSFCSLCVRFCTLSCWIDTSILSYAIGAKTPISGSMIRCMYHYDSVLNRCDCGDSVASNFISFHFISYDSNSNNRNY